MELKIKFIRIFSFFLDVLIVLSALVASYVFLTGGNEFYLGDVKIQLYSARNVVTFLFVLFIFRFITRYQVSFLLINKLSYAQLSKKLLNFWVNFYNRLESLKEKDVVNLLLIIIFVSTLIKILNAWFYYGFFSGDDVEIFEMVQAHLFQWKWEAWNLRNAFYPMVFIAPVHIILKAFGVTSPDIFVFAGRMVVVTFSILNILLVYKIVSKLFKDFLPGIIAAFLLAFSQMHITFAASVLPRTVSSTFILLAFFLLIRKPQNNLFVFFAGIALGISGAIRFSEIVFIIPCLIYLIIEKRYWHTVWISLTSLVTGLVILGISDYFYWGSLFFSLKNIINYTLVNKLSSRDYQSPLYYITHITEWSNIFILILAYLSFKSKKYSIFLWTLIPLLILSLLPHKESRYLVPIIPFLFSLSGIGAWYLLRQIADNSTSTLQKKQVTALILSFLFIGSLLYEIDGYRFKRSESGIDIAKYISAQNDLNFVAIEQAWRAGGKIYLNKIKNLENILTDSISDAQYFSDIIEKPGLQMVALKASNVVKYNCHVKLVEKGFREIYVKQKGKNKYRLYKMQ